MTLVDDSACRKTGRYALMTAGCTLHLQQVLKLGGSHGESVLVCFNLIKCLHQGYQPSGQADQICTEVKKIIAQHPAKKAADQSKGDTQQKLPFAVK